MLNSISYKRWETSVLNSKKNKIKKAYFSNAFVFKYIATNFAAYQIRPCIHSQTGRQIGSAQFYSVECGEIEIPIKVCGLTQISCTKIKFML